MRFDPDYRPFVAPKCIYIVPLSADPARYQVLTPARLTGGLADLLIQQRLMIYTFRGCPVEAVTSIRDQLRRTCELKPSRYSIRMNQLLVAGTVLVVLGIINFTLPDPLPLADEILMIGGGAGVGILGYRNRRKVLPLLNRKTAQAVNRIQSLDCSEDLLLSRIHAAIAARDAGGRTTFEEGAEGTTDPFEVESRWLVEYLDLQQLIDSKAVTRRHLAALLEVLTDAFPLARFLSLERRLRKNPGDGGARTARDRLALRYGLSADALTVYAEFYRLAREIVSSKNG
jgi:hypothetical protein